MIRETPNSLESPPPDEEGANEYSAASANFAVAAFYEIEALGKHLLAKFGTKYYVLVGTVVAANLGKESTLRGHLHDGQTVLLTSPRELKVRGTLRHLKIKR